MQNLKQRVLAVERKSSNSHNTSTSTPSSTARGKQDSKPQITQSTHHASSANGSTRRLSIQAPQPVEVESIQMKVGRLTIKKTRVIQNQVSTSNNKTSHLKIVRNPRFGKGSIFNQNRPSISLQSKLSESIRPSNSNQIVKDANGKWVKVEQSIQPKRKIALSTIQSNLQSSKNEGRNNSSVIEQEIEDEQPQQLQQHEEPEYIDEEEEDEEEQYSEQQDLAFGQAPNDEYDDNQYEGQEVELDNQSDNFYEEEEPVKQAPEYSTKYIVALNNLSRKSTANDIRRLIEPSEKNYIEDIQMEQADDYDCLIYLTNEDSQMRVIKLLHGKRVEGQILRADPAEISVEDQIESKQPVQPEPRSQPQTNKSTAPTQVQPDHSQRKPQQSHREVPALPDSNTYVQQQKNIISQHLKQNTDSRSSSHKFEPQQQTHDQARSTTKQNTQPALSSRNAPPPSSQQQQQQQSQVSASSTRANQNQYEEQRSRPQTSRSNQQETPNSRSTNNSRQNVQENNRQQTNNYSKETNPQNQSSNKREQQQNNDNQRFQNRNNTKNDSPNYQRSESPQNQRNQNRNQERQRSRSPPSHVKPERRHQAEEINRNQRYVHRSPQRENTQRRRQSIESPPRRNQEVRRNSNERSSRQPERQQQHHSSNNRSNHVTRR